MAHQALQKSYKSLCNNMEIGDLKTAEKDILALNALCESQIEALQRMRSAKDSFSISEYIQSGDFSQQLLENCEKMDVDVKGTFPLFEMFPYRVKVDVENQDMYIDRKKVQCLRPSSFVKKIKLEQDKLLKTKFNSAAFAKELAAAYDLTLMKKNIGKAYSVNADCSLKEIYQSLTPMGRFRKDYDQQSYAFDLARLYAAHKSGELECTDDGRKMQFGPSRSSKNEIRILDADGNEQFLAEIRFF